MTDADTITEIKYHLIEEDPTVVTTMPSALWTIDEVVDALNSAQEWVLREAAPQFARVTIPTVPNILRYILPQDWMATQRVSWTTADGETRELVRDSSWSADYLSYDWTTIMAATPKIYSDVDAPLPAIQVMPTSLDNGVVTVLYVAIPETFDASGIDWTIPPMTIPMAKWKAIAILLAKDGRGQDLPRAQWALTRANEGLTALKLFLRGWH